MKGSYKVSERTGRRLLAHKERLRASMAATYKDAQRWYDASLAVSTPGLGDGGRSVGEITHNLSVFPEGQRSYVRWFDGTITVTWIEGKRLTPGTWVVVTSHWKTPRVQVQVGERLLIVDEIIDTIPAKVLDRYEDYWRYSRELDELELKDHLMIAPIDMPVADAPELTVTITPIYDTISDDELRDLGRE
jgi:hypothetical protein